MNKEQLRKNVDKAKNEYKDGLTLIYNELNNGQRKKLLKNPEVKALFERFGVIEGDANG